MALIDKASLLMVPSTYEAGKLYNVLPSGNRAPDSTDQNSGYDQTRADFTFDRGSNAAATRIGSDGLIKKYRENKLLQSNNFGTTWANSSTTETGGQSGYDGTNNAWLLTKSASDGYIYQNISQSGVQCVSVYAKANAIGGIQIYVNAGTTQEQKFNLTNGTLIGSGNNIDAKIESVGNGWYRCSMALSDAITRVRFYPTTSAGDKTGTSGSIFIQSAQLESGLVATDVLTSGATTAKAGVLVDLPRINYDANGENGSLLLEPSRQNKIQYSEYFGASYWTKTRASITSNSTMSPNGTLNASKLVEDTANGSHFLLVNPVYTTSSTNNVVSLSLFAKKSERDLQIQSFASGGGENPKVNFDLTNGTATSVGNITPTFSIQSFGNDWYRCTLTYTVSQSGSGVRFYISMVNNNNTSYQGNGSSGVYIFGAQLELGSYVSSYIPNHGTTGGVTRAADVCNGAGDASTFNDSEGVLYAEISALSNDLTNRGITISDGSVNNRITMFFTNVSNAIQVKVVVGGSNSLNSYIAIPNISLHNKFALKYKQNDFSLFVNGSELITDTSGNTFSNGTLTKLAFDRGDGAEDFYGNVKQVAVFNEALSNAELATLTTL